MSVPPKEPGDSSVVLTEGEQNPGQDAANRGRELRQDSQEGATVARQGSGGSQEIVCFDIEDNEGENAVEVGEAQSLYGSQSKKAAYRQTLDQKDLLCFAKQILIGLAIIELLAAAAHVILACKEVKDDVSHQLSVGVIPAAFTLVVGFYFAKRS